MRGPLSIKLVICCVLETSERNLNNVATFPVRKLQQRKKEPNLIHLCLQECDNVQFGR